MKRLFLYMLPLLLLCMRTAGQVVGDSIVASLLTCSPGTEVYSLYGHTALRVQNFTQGQDVVFNYGVFDFRRPHFTWHFILGECDYEVAGYPFAAFLQEYEKRGSSVTEQVLNLTPEETNRLYALLIVNCQPQNKTYRYNFLLNNCTTKARDIIEQASSGEVVYKSMQPERPTYRSELRACTRDYPWAQAGNDLLLGAACDTLLDVRAEQFLPAGLFMQFIGAEIYDARNNRRPLLASTNILLEGREQTHEEPFPLSPLLTSLLVLLFYLLVVALERYTGRMFWGMDILTMTLQGVAGILLCFMFLFSQHPTVDSNWQIGILNPLPLFCMPWVVKCAVKKKTCLYHYLNILWLVLFMVMMPWIPQKFSILTLPLALILLTRPVSYYLHYHRKKE